jgi:hypothetical protein
MLDLGTLGEPPGSSLASTTMAKLSEFPASPQIQQRASLKTTQLPSFSLEPGKAY